MYFTDTPELRKFEREMRQKAILTGVMMIAKILMMSVIVATVSVMSAEQSLRKARVSNAQNIQSPR